jgi:hypothetical protein
MRKYFRSLALVPPDHSDRSRWLCLWSADRTCFDFVSGEPREGESFRQCIQRQVAHELDLEQKDFLVANMAQLNLEFAAVLPGDTEPRHVGVAFYIVNLYRESARDTVESLPGTRWLGNDELLAGKTADGSPVSRVLTYLLKRSDVIPAHQGDRVW